MKDDPFDLKGIDKSFSELNNKLNKTFKKESLPNYSRNYHPQPDHRQKPKITKSDIEIIKKIAVGTNNYIKTLYKLATKNKIPKDYDEIMAMRDKLELEKKQRLEIIEAKKRINKLLKEKKAETKAERKARINKIKSVISKVTKL